MATAAAAAATATTGATALDDRALEVLEYARVLERLARHTSFSAGREAALALRPWLPAPWADRLDYSADGKRPVRPRGEAARAQNGELQGCVES